MTIFDWNEHRKDGELGVANFTLKDLEADPEQENLKTPVMLQGKERGHVNYDIKYFPVLTPKKMPDGTLETLPETSTRLYGPLSCIRTDRQTRNWRPSTHSSSGQRH